MLVLFLVFLQITCRFELQYADVSQPACSGHSWDFKVSSVSLAAWNTTATSSWSASEWLSGIHAASGRAVWNNSLRSHAETSPVRLDSETVWRARWLISTSHASVWKSCVTGVRDDSHPRYHCSNHCRHVGVVWAHETDLITYKITKNRTSVFQICHWETFTDIFFTLWLNDEA